MRRISLLSALLIFALPGFAHGQAIQVPKSYSQLTAADSGGAAAGRAALGLGSTTVGARVSTWSDTFSRYADGAWAGGAAASGQTWTLNAATSGAGISGGRLVNAGSNVGAFYAWGDVGASGTVVRHSATVRFGSTGSTSGGAVAVVISNNLNTLDNLIHLVVGPSTWTLTLAHDVGGTLVFDGLTDTAGLTSQAVPWVSTIAKDTDYSVSMTIIGSTAWLELPDGTRRAFTDSRISSWAGRYFFIECLRGSTTDYQPMIGAVTVDSTSGAPAPTVGIAAATPQSLPRVIQAAAGQTAPLELIVDSAGAGLGVRAADGSLGVGTATPQAMLEVVAPGTGLPGIRVSPRPGQVGALIQLDGLGLGAAGNQFRADYNGVAITYITRFGVLNATNLVGIATPSVAGLTVKGGGLTGPDVAKFQDNAAHDLYRIDKAGRPVAGTPGTWAPAPTIIVGAGAGAGGAATLVNATDVGGTISITTGPTPAAGATLATVTFGTAWATTPRIVILAPANAAAAGLGAYEDQASRSTTTSTIKSGSAVPAASTVYLLSFEVKG